MNIPPLIPRGPRRPFLACSLLLLALSLLTAAHATTYYFSSTLGNDANSGTSTSAPKRTLSAAEGLALPGNTLLFRRGDAWYDPWNSFDLSGKSGTSTNPIIIDSYTDGNSPNPNAPATVQPIIANMVRLPDWVSPSSPNGWSNVSGTTRWKRTVSGFSHAMRVFVNNQSKFQVNRVDQAAVDTAVDSTGKWYLYPTAPGVSGVLYVNTGSSTVGPVNVEVMPMGSVSTLKMKNTNWVTIRNLDFRGGSNYNVAQIDAPCSNLVFDTVTIERANQGGIVVGNNGGTADYVSNITIKNSMVDKVWSTLENNNGDTIQLSGDGIFFLHAVDGGLIQNNVVRNWGHVGITLTAYAAGYRGVKNVVMELNDVSADQSWYMHGFDVSGSENMCTGNVVRQNFFHDFTSTCHALGNGNEFYSNIFANVTMTQMGSQHSHQPYAMDMMPWQIPNGGPWMVAHDNFYVNNTFYNIEQYPVIANEQAGNPTATGMLVFYNNIFYKYGTANGTNDVAIHIDSTVSGNVYMRGNDFWDSTVALPGGAYVVNWKGTRYTATGLNTTVGSTYCSINQQLNPGLKNPDAFLFYLDPNTSPNEVRFQGYHVDPSLMESGFVDYEGSAWHNPPSMGAIQTP